MGYFKISKMMLKFDHNWMENTWNEEAQDVLTLTGRWKFIRAFEENDLLNKIIIIFDSIIFIKKL